jgi:uncharacterized membrane protein
MFQKTIFAFLILFMSIGSAYAQFAVRNTSDKPIYVAYAKYESDSKYKGWVSHGWYKLIPGEKATLINWLNFSGGTVYVHAHSTDGDYQWGSDIYLVVDRDNAFSIKNCNLDYHTNSNYVTRKFTKVATGDTKEFTYTFDD